ncbi:hypothetical protein R6L23_16415 [Streptomyces sp. SR27]|uniref:hypothetical protein n=1 Tax=Streptomyces sp. SR27 TaxID=3076630 RepID=UPI00295AD5BC|nr:hypothetical protein [Streptomyces sp. SR27]MDV9189780.1 hypothetical protein [Streptomyces sp. SR27]
MPSDLYQRYMRATSALRAHDAGCSTCTAARRCSAGARLAATFDRLFDAYRDSLNRRA